MAEKRWLNLSDVAQHCSKDDCWLVINGTVLNVTKFLEEHPGGEELLIEAAGKDATKQFEDIGHSNAAKKLLAKFQVGVLHGYSIQDADTNGVPLKESKNKEMSASVIKEEKMPPFATFAEFFVPLLVSGVYFGYRYFTLANQTGN